MNFQPRRDDGIFMASADQVKKYLAYWFQVGKPLICPRGDRRILPRTIVVGDRYAKEFEECWQQLTAPECRDCYLEGTNQTLGELLSPRWEIFNCVRCAMPIPIDELGLQTGCPCFDLHSWPNLDAPIPHCPYNVRAQLTLIHQRLRDRRSAFG